MSDQARKHIIRIAGFLILLLAVAAAIVPAERAMPGRIIVGALLLAPPTRKLGGLAAVALFLGVLPGNINMVRLWWDKPWYMRAGGCLVTVNPGRGVHVGPNPVARDAANASVRAFLRQRLAPDAHANR